MQVVGSNTLTDLSFFQHWLPTPDHHLVVVLIALLVYILTTRSRHQQRSPSTAIAWVLGLALLPYLVLPIYVLFGQRKVRPVGALHARRSTPIAHWAAELIESFGLAPPSRCSIRMHPDGNAARQALWELIEGARQHIDICTFIIGNDALGREVIHRLALRAAQGVKVRVLLDGFGALSLGRGHFRALRAAGGEVAVFRPLFSLRGSGPRNLRNHRKFALADGRWLWLGGRNLAGEYFGAAEANKGEKHTQDRADKSAGGQAPGWVDLSFDLQGDVATAAARQFEHDWDSVHRRQSTPRPITPLPWVSKGSHAQFLPSGPDQAEDTAHALLIDACFRAQRRFIAVTPYFVPGDDLRDALRLAARRGVEVMIAIPEKSNHRLADFVRTRAMRDLARAGVKFRMLPFMAHAKAIVMDDDLALCGSINLDLRSLLINYEAAVVFYDRREIDWLAHWIEETASTGQDYHAQRPSLLRDVAEGLLLTVTFQL
ncbi:MAG: phospholipase D-like domain-containing protein [Burkholderiaceae bacterium]|nr:phospholipase D-like domain-containing protein [Burkholderiaceae bacterium]